MATIESPVLQTVTPVTHDLGAFKVHRTLPARERTMVGPFIFVDEFGPARLAPGQGMDVRPHPHINLATVPTFSTAPSSIATASAATR